MAKSVGIRRTYDVIKQFPNGLTCRELIGYLDEQDKKSASSNLSHLVRYKLVTKANDKKIDPITKVPVTVYIPTMKNYSSTPSINYKDINDIKDAAIDEELKELRKFKEQALLLHPELSHSPIEMLAIKILKHYYPAFDDSDIENVVEIIEKHLPLLK